ncbi:putative pentatricopeptide repeat-containing protein At3g25970 [Diospyros lotus]|uniref:putative pentatricopeptide repeat-containing protein At3g25970 n=1 Tax=Diospyros lotus TaxID=55363 RepID=UPI0022570893|nr:putative pentatricopeptide repeat-containing protein At3g25970 [Diospyros lotus]
MEIMRSLVESSVASLYKVSVSHGWAIKRGTFADTYTANIILSGYTKCRDVGVASKLFDELPNRDTVTWNSMITGCVSYRNLWSAWELLKSMRRCGFMVDGYTFGSLLKGVACEGCIDLGLQAHSLVLKTGHGENVYSASALLDMYAKCDRVQDAYLVFQGMSERNSVSWNALIAGFAKVGDRETAFLFLDTMERGVNLDDGTFAPLLTLLDDAEFCNLNKLIHAKIIKHGLAFDNTLCNALITFHSDCGSIEDAKQVFESATGNQDLVTWNSMLTAYLAHNRGGHALEIFLEMRILGFEPDIYTYTTMISACFEDVHQNQGKSLHALVIKRGLEQSIPISNSLIAMYLKSSRKYLEDAVEIFESMNAKDSVSWNSILTGFSQYGLSEHTLKFFGRMQFGTLHLDHFAFSAVLRSCSDLATLQLGQQVHALALKLGFESNDFVASSLICMYSKCGIAEDAAKSFEATTKDNSITWNSMIFAYAQHGQGKAALDLFFLMRDSRVELDHITFVAVLTACSHIGLVEEGYNILKSMESVDGIPPRMEHYACGVDLFGRARRLEEAKALIEAMPFEPDATVWRTVPGACRICGDIDMAAQAASYLLELEPKEHCTYVLLSDMYGKFNRWNERAGIKRMMRERGVKKLPGWSWIEVKNKVHAFNAEDHSHPHCKQIYQVLEELVIEIKDLEDNAYGKYTWDLDIVWGDAVIQDVHGMVSTSYMFG